VVGWVGWGGWGCGESCGLGGMHWWVQGLLQCSCSGTLSGSGWQTPVHTRCWRAAAGLKLIVIMVSNHPPGQGLTEHHAAASAALPSLPPPCRCGRCVAEEEVPADVAELLEDVVSRVRGVSL
jgi:hypothetical protein